MTGQVKSYLATTSAVSRTALYTFFGGSNDLLYRVKKHPADSQAMLNTATKAVDAIKSQIAAIAVAGGKTFVWLNMFPIERTPAGSAFAPALVPAIDQFNAAWAKALDELKIRFPDCMFIGVDFHGLSNAAFADPAKYGFANMTEAAQGKNVDPDTYLFWDAIHPTSKGHQWLANAVYVRLFPDATAKPIQ